MPKRAGAWGSPWVWVVWSCPGKARCLGHFHQKTSRKEPRARKWNYYRFLPGVSTHFCLLPFENDNPSQPIVLTKHQAAHLSHFMMDMMIFPLRICEYWTKSNPTWLVGPSVPLAKAGPERKSAESGLIDGHAWKKGTTLKPCKV